MGLLRPRLRCCRSIKNVIVGLLLSAYHCLSPSDQPVTVRPLSAARRSGEPYENLLLKITHRNYAGFRLTNAVVFNSSSLVGPW
jgi:hypothetical protein